MLEQLIQILPSGGKEWVKHHRPATLEEATALMDSYVVTQDLSSLTPRTGISKLRPLTPSKGGASGGSQGLVKWLLLFRSLPPGVYSPATKVELRGDQSRWEV